jgi:pimeloyl-ACP methyl ester carboxylesterase
MTGTFRVKVSGKPDIHCRVQGSGPAVTLLHGVGANLDSSDEVAQRMRGRFRIICMDLAGRGKSGGLHGDRTLQDFADDVSRVWDHLGLQFAPFPARGGPAAGGRHADALLRSGDTVK